MDIKRFNIKAQVVRVCEGGRSAFVCAVDKGGRTTMFLRNRRFMDYDRKHQLEQEVAMAAVEGTGRRPPHSVEAAVWQGGKVRGGSGKESRRCGDWYPQGDTG